MSSVDPLDEIFDAFVENSNKIFKNRDVLRPTYVPSKLPHRDNEIKNLGKKLAPVLVNDTPSNIFIYGKTGTGKTAVAKFVLKALYERTRKANVNFSHVYINCQLVDTTYRVFAQLCDALGIKVPFTGLPTAEVYERFKEEFDKTGKLLVIVLDEIDALHKKSIEALYALTRINTELENAKVSLIGITNDTKFKNYIDPRIRSSLSEEEIVFTPYNANQLKDILHERSLIAFNDGVIENGTIELCAALAAQEEGDARRALDLLRVSGELAEREGANKVTVKHVKEAQKVIEKNVVNEIISTLPLHSKVVLLSIYLLERFYKDATTSGAIYNVYSKLAQSLGMDPLTARRITDFINELDMLGIISSTVVSKGRYGRTKRVNLTVQLKEVKEALAEDWRFESLLDFKPSLD